jgi:glycosyltransferase involved in cell wall biosynthesis
MKILHLNASDYLATGGTGTAMHRMQTGLNRAGHQSQVLCIEKELPDEDTVYLHRSLPTRLAGRVLKKVERELGLEESSSILNSIGVLRHPLYQSADVVHLHCLHEDFLSYLTLPWLSAQKPTILHVHDMWAFSGQCHYSYGCDRWKTGCGNCPHLRNQKRDNTALEWKLKNWAYGKSRLQVVTHSTWTTTQVQQGMLSRFPLTCFPCGLDTQIFYPRDRQSCQEALGLPPGKKVVMFGAPGLQDYRKGGDLLVKALRALPPSLKAELVLITMGKNGTLPDAVDIPTYHFGAILSDRLKAILYAAADLFLFPTRHETFGIVATESLACGTPVVAFRVGGVPDIVRPGVTGFLAEPENVGQFRDYTVQLLTDDRLRRSLGTNGRNIAQQEYSLETCTQNLLALYSRLLPSQFAVAPTIPQPIPAR